MARTLSNYSIPHPTTGMQLGEVEILPFNGGDNIAQYVAFAASVALRDSKADAIERIGAALGRFTVQHSSVRSLSVPLLGAGEGTIE